MSSPASKLAESAGPLPASFRDPSGRLYVENGVLYRSVYRRYREHYDALMDSGLYQALTDQGWMVPHTEVAKPTPAGEDLYKVLRPEKIPFVSYPYEWCFSQLKDAALVTLKIQKRALDCGMSLKDASAYNIQFRSGGPVLIDTLSFERYEAGRPWVAYRQFCQHFLAPLALMSYRDSRLNRLLGCFIDGVPLDLAGSLLPRRTWLRFSLLSHIHLHALAQKKFQSLSSLSSPHASSGDQRPWVPASVGMTRRGNQRMSKTALYGLVESLASAVNRLSWKPAGTVWAEYYEDTNYPPVAFEEKKRRVSEWIEHIRPGSVWDLGANTGLFSRLASDRGIPTVAFDQDPAAVEKNYLRMRETKEKHLLPLWVDLTNPSPAIGWENQERESFLSRGPADLVLALALVHHLAIANNLPFGRIASFFARSARNLVIEFVPKEDSQVRRLLASREDIFPDYDANPFEQAFLKFFTLREKRALPESSRTLYWFENRA